MSDYAITREYPSLAFEDAVVRITAALADEGFGVLTEIDIRATLKKKLGVEFRPYVILGACNPELAHQALSAEPNIGVLLPCNVVVMERAAGGSTIAAFNPITGFALVGRDDIKPIAVEVEKKLCRALDALGSAQE